MMLVVPMESADHKSDAVLIVLGPDNLERMRLADPAEVPLRKAGMRLVNPDILIAFEEPSGRFQELAQRGDVAALIEFLQRGWAYRPEKGDHDRGPESLHKTQ